MEGEFFSKWSFPNEKFDELTKELTGDNSLFIRVISFELGNLNLEGNVAVGDKSNRHFIMAFTSFTRYVNN